MNIVQLETKYGRLFRVAIENNNQEKRLIDVIRKNKNKSYEKFVNIYWNKFNGIHNIKQFEKIANSLI